MNLVTYLSRSRGVRNSARRLGRIRQRFGVSHAPMRGALNELLSICGAYDCTPTLAVTAVLIERYPDFFRNLAASRADLAVHGYVHTDHALLDERYQYEHLEKALHAFAGLGIRPRGFRHPYLRHNNATWAAAARLGFTHSSNRSITWDVVDGLAAGEGLAAYHKGLALYGATVHRDSESLPGFVDGGILDMPASLPDDEAVIDRLGLSGRHAGIFWLRMLQRAVETGEHVTIVVHNERVMVCANSLRALLRSARANGVWIASLSEVNDWWRKQPTPSAHVRARWPGKATAALSITSDVDAMTLLDFVRRPLEV